MALGFPIVDGGVQIVQVQQGVRRIVGVGFGSVFDRTDRWFIQKDAAPTMRVTSMAATTFEPLATQDLQNRWTLDDWKFASDPARSHVAADDTAVAHNTSGRLRHGASAFNYIKTRSAVVSGIPTEQVLIARILEPFDSEGQVPDGGGSQCDPQFYKLLPIAANGTVIAGEPPIGYLFVPSYTPAGAPLGISEYPHSLEIWFIKDRASFPSPPNQAGFMIQVDDDPAAPDGDTPLDAPPGTPSVLAHIRTTLGYGALPNVATVIMSTTTYDTVRPRFP